MDDRNTAVMTGAGADCHWVDPPETRLRHREPRSGVAIQCKVYWIASSATAFSQ
jgi:hypothetical protein